MFADNWDRYEAGCHYAWIVRENGSEAHLASLQDIREVLEAIKPRWAVAEEYLELLKDTEYHYNGGCSG